MRWHRRHLLAALLATVSWPALGQSMGLGLDIGSTSAPAGGAPLDGFTQPAAAYSFRKLRSAYSGPAIRIRRASDNAETDIGFVGFVPGLGSPVDVAQANAHCAATTCTVATWYDQSGNALHGTRAAAQQPSFIFNCAPNGQPCLRATSTGQLLGAPYSAVANPVTMNGVAIRNSGAGTCVFPQHYDAGNALGSSGTANQWVMFASGAVGAPAADAAWHSGIGVFNGASSVLRVDATETPGTSTASTTASSLLPFYGADGTVCSAAEVVWWSGYGLSASERAALSGNQRGFWGF